MKISFFKYRNNLSLVLVTIILSALWNLTFGSGIRNYDVPDSTWVIGKSLIVNSEGKPENDLIKYILDKLKSKSGRGERVSKEEFLSYFDRPESDTVYAKQLIKYATPLSRDIQKKEHRDFTKIFLNEKRLEAGVEFIDEHKKLLSGAEEKYGVQIKDLVSILMWESGLGEFTGKYNVFNILLGQVLFLDDAQKYAVDNLKKEGKENPLDDSAFAASEKRRLDYRKKDAANSLIALLRYSKKYGMDPLKQKGSWGGAIGFVQFMPYNFQYIIDADSNGEKDLFTWPDAIMSAANFLKNYGGYKVNIKSRRRAMLRYNASEEYADGVILYADKVWEKYLSSKEINKSK
jgi:membrane-bound lytic murein transglycosylase B